MLERQKLCRDKKGLALAAPEENLVVPTIAASDVLCAPESPKIPKGKSVYSALPTGLAPAT